MYSKVLTVAAVCVVCVLAAPPTDVVPLEKQQPTVIPILSQSEELEANGTFKFSYETGNGIKREEEAYVKIVPKAKSRSASSNEGGESDEDSNEIHVQRGSYSYTAPDGTVITVRYIADENGFQPIGDHIPRVPSSVPATSSEKSGKLMKPADSAVSASEPKKQEKPAPAPASASAPAASRPAPAAKPSASNAKPEEPPKEATTEKSNENSEKPAPEESSSESTFNPTSIQPTSAEATEASASTSVEASDDKQTTTNPITEASPTSEAENPSTTSSSTPSSGEESSTTTAAS
ncbi:flocculation protein FLO11-like [Aricia agestis]|uniref:flocculation protein FLO11-like n=1 Tax=Aricia agestis TaxID=91739 RepID=UPI001C207290|nr:flocculation protein FLO11-like [Aricia agestis]